MCAEAVKNQRARVVIDGYTAEGLGVGRLDNGMAVFVPGAARGDVLTIRLVQVRKHFAYGRIEEILTPSSARVPVDCPQFPRCGGCDFRHLTYEEELDLKARRVQDALVRLGGIDAPLPEIVPSPRVLRYRNKTASDIPDGKVCAYEVLNRKELLSFHGDLKLWLLQNGLDANVNSGITVEQGGNRTVAELKQEREQQREQQHTTTHEHEF